jgi:hypothetical protein
MADASFAEVVLRYAFDPGHKHYVRPPRVKARLPDEDPPETTSDPAALEKVDLSELIGLRVGLMYEDAEGEVSEREVTVRTLRRGADGGISLQCLCHMRKAHRQFLLRRVRALYDIETGEAFEDPAAFLRAFGGADPSRNPVEKAAAAISGVKAELHALVFLARCDGWHESEVPVAVNFVLDGPATSVDVDIREVERQVRALDPDEDTFRRAVHFVRLSGADATRRLTRAIRRIVDADGFLSDAEAHFVTGLAGFDRQ